MSMSQKPRKITISDIAELCGVSPTTVSLVLRNKQGVGSETRQRVLDAAETLGYITKSSQSSATNKAYKIGVIMRIRDQDDLSANHFYAPVISGINTICRNHQNRVIYENTPVDAENVSIEVPHLLADNLVDGLIFIGMQLNNALVQQLHLKGVGYVLVDSYATHPMQDTVTIDNHSGVSRAVEYLIEQGHQHIALIGSDESSYPSIQERRKAYIQTIEKHQLTPYLFDSPFMPENSAANVVVKYLEKHPEVTAIYSTNDLIAVRAMQKVQEAGYQIPKDLSFFGFDNIMLAQHVSPPLSTVGIDKTNMGRIAAQLLLNRIRYPEAGNTETLIKPDLVLRKSVYTRFK